MKSMLLKRAFCISLVCAIGWTAAVFSQVPGDGNKKVNSILNLQKPGIDLKKMSLLDPERFTMKQQYIMKWSHRFLHWQAEL